MAPWQPAIRQASEQEKEDYGIFGQGREKGGVFGTLSFWYIRTEQGLHMVLEKQQNRCLKPVCSRIASYPPQKEPHNTAWIPAHPHFVLGKTGVQYVVMTKVVKKTPKNLNLHLFLASRLFRYLFKNILLHSATALISVIFPHLSQSIQFCSGWFTV